MCETGKNTLNKGRGLSIVSPPHEVSHLESSDQNMLFQTCERLIGENDFNDPRVGQVVW